MNTILKISMSIVLVFIRGVVPRYDSTIVEHSYCAASCTHFRSFSLRRKVCQSFRRQLQTSGSRCCEAAEEVLTGARATLHPERGVNKAFLVGRVGRDPEVRGSVEKPVAIFPLATTTYLQLPDGRYTEKTQWHRICVFRPGIRDIVASSVKKGDRVMVQGMITYSQFSYFDEQKKDESAVKVTSIIAEDVLDFTQNPQRLQRNTPVTDEPVG